MSLKTSSRRYLTIGALALGAATLPMLAVSPAQAGNEPYIGWDFGGGVGVGIGTPPSAYDRCPNYGWGYDPYTCHYRPIHYRRHARPRPHHPVQRPRTEQAPTNLGPSDQE
jgi:hypothetical protein